MSQRKGPNHDRLISAHSRPVRVESADWGKNDEFSNGYVQLVSSSINPIFELKMGERTLYFNGWIIFIPWNASWWRNSRWDEKRHEIDPKIRESPWVPLKNSMNETKLTIKLPLISNGGLNNMIQSHWMD